MRSLFSIFFVATFMSTQLLAWKAGHQYHVEESVKMASEGYQKLISPSMMEKIKIDYSLYIDVAGKYPKGLVSEREQELLNNNFIYSPRDLHKPYALPVMFKLLVDAIKKKKAQKIAFWTACISHHVNDAYSAHYDIMNHVVSDVFLPLNKVKNADGEQYRQGPSSSLSLLPVVKHSLLLKKRRKIVADYEAKVINKNFDELYEYLRLLRYKRESEVRKFLPEISGAFNEVLQGDSHEATLKLYLGLFNLTTLGNKETADILFTAHQYALNRYRFKLPEVAPFSNTEASLPSLKSRSVMSENVFKGLMGNLNEVSADVGILVEPSLLDGEGSFGYSSKVLAALMMNSLKKHKINYSVIDVRSLHKKSLPERMEKFSLDPKQIPTLIVPAVKFQNSDYSALTKRNVMRQLAAYMRKGGKVMWIGSGGEVFFGKHAKRAIKIEKDHEIFAKSSLKESGLNYSAALLGDEDSRVFLLKNDPFKYTRLYDARSYMTIQPTAGVTPLVDLVNEESEERVTIAALIDGRKQKKQLLVVSSIALSPFLLHDQVDSFSPLQYDQQADKLFQKLLKALRGE